MPPIFTRFSIFFRLYGNILVSILGLFCIPVICRGYATCPAIFENMDSLKRDELLERADSLRKVYDFESSLGIYDKILAETSDSVQKITIQGKKILSENGAAMSDFVSTPDVLDRHLFSLDDFYLFYPLPDKCWRPLSDTSDVVFVPSDSDRIIFSMADESGSINLYTTRLQDSLWTYPTLLDEKLTSTGDEIYPMLSADGKQLYFASSGLYGMGGFDLYVSDWDEIKNEWGPPANMGFPFSSPFDDFLFINTSNGKYSIFASNRDCSEDSVYVYVVNYDSVPVRKSMRNAKSLSELCHLLPGRDISKTDNNHVSSSLELLENEGTRKYVEKAAEVRSLRDTIFAYTNEIDKNRILFAESDDTEEREKLTGKIMQFETRLPFLQDSLSRATILLQEIEMQFLFSGITFDPSALMQEADREIKGTSSNYVFTRKSPGEPLNMKFDRPEEKFDYTFMVLPEGRFAEDNTLPEGLVYQIQLFVLTSPATVKMLKGLSPVFEDKSNYGQYIYRAGAFRKYSDAMANMNIAKRAGFKSAFITAFYNGKRISVAKARELETDNH